MKITIVETRLDCVTGHCPFAFEGCDEIDGFDFELFAVVAKFVDGDKEAIVYSHTKESIAVIKYLKPGYDASNEDSIDAHLMEERVTAEQLAARGITFFKLCDCLDEEKAREQVDAALIAREYKEEQVTIPGKPPQLTHEELGLLSVACLNAAYASRQVGNNAQADTFHALREKLDDMKVWK